MGWSVYLLDQKNNRALEIGGAWASDFPVETLISIESVEEELLKRGRSLPGDLARRLFKAAETAGFDVRTHEGQEIPDGFSYADIEDT